MTNVFSWKYLSVFIFFLFLITFYLHPLGFINEDLPRHLKNGQLILETKKIPKTNLYSYTYPDHTTYMHHWGAGVIFFLLVDNFGIVGFQIIMIALTIFSFWLIAYLSFKEFGYEIGFVSTFLGGLIFVSRTQMRPESFSYLFISITIYILWNYSKSKLSSSWLWLLVPIHILWINLHVFFIFGLKLLIIFGLNSAFEKNWKKLFDIVKIFAVSCAALLINPYGLSGILAPFTVVTESQKSIVENLPVLKFLKHMNHSSYVLFLGCLLVSIIFLLYFWKTKPKTSNLVAITLITLSYGYLGFNMNRLTILYGITIPLIFSYLFYNWNKSFSSKRQKSTKILLKNSVFGLIILAITLIFLNIDEFSFSKMGLENKIDAPANFIKDNQIKGPILNNFNSGSYLIYYLYPDWKVFIDNRSEAYPDDFIINNYTRIETSEEKFKQLDEKYKFNVIFGEISAMPPEWLVFLTNRKNDSNWVLVYKDKNAVIFIRNISQNSKIIERFKIRIIENEII